MTLSFIPVAPGIESDRHGRATPGKFPGGTQFRTWGPVRGPAPWPLLQARNRMWRLGMEPLTSSAAEPAGYTTIGPRVLSCAGAWAMVSVNGPAPAEPWRNQKGLAWM